jgi:hypothetical protein
LAPLAPGPLDVVLQSAGIEAARRRIELVAGRFVDVAFDAIAQDVARAVSLDVQLDFVAADDGAPVADLDVTWHADGGERRVRSDALGRVAFAGVDRQRPMSLTLAYPRDSGNTLPRWPETQALALALDESAIDARTATLRQRVPLRALRWLLLRTDAPLQPFHRRGGEAYPVFVLQRAEGEAWRDVAADFFLPQPQGALAVSLAQPGRYRVRVLQAPWSSRLSEGADSTSAQDGRIEVALLPTPGRRVALSLVADGAPLRAAPVHFVADARGLPPLVRDSDADGRVVLDDVTVDAVTIEVPGYGARRVTLDAPETMVSLRRAR